MKFPIREQEPLELFPQLREIPQPPKRLYIRGQVDTQDKKLIAIVGSRACTSYGKAVCRSLIEGLRGYPVVIVSGLAFGIDKIAHEASLEAGLVTIAFPGSSLDARSLYPAQHRGLAQQILENGGALISEYKEPITGAHWVFPQRNRLMAGIADMTIVIEAKESSGTLITARLATEYNKIVGAVPGPITSPVSVGANWLLKLGAVPITESADILRELGLALKPTTDIAEYLMLNSDEERILQALAEPKTKETLIHELSLDPASANIVFSTLEIKGVIQETLGIVERII